MASVIYPHKNNGLDKKPCQTGKVLTRTTRASFPGGLIVAKGNIIEGIEAME